MKQTLLLNLINIVLFSLLLSCSKTVADGEQQTTNPVIRQNQTFIYRFGLIGIEDGLAITKQASHFEISKIERDSSGNLIYTYKPAAAYVGRDSVEITHYISIGGPTVGSTTTKISITVVK